MSDQGEHQIDTIRNLRDCRHYATLLCAARICGQRWREMPLTTLHVLEEAVKIIHINADPAIYPALDTIKRVMEIDETVDNPNAVLMHAGIAMKAKETERGEQPV